jgi:hypothetical protein
VPNVLLAVCSRPRLRRAAFTLVAAAALAPAAAEAQFSSITFFGDSYVDTGNAAILTGGANPPTPPYFPGRFSNGPVLTDYIALGLGRPQDVAPGFATGIVPGGPGFAASGNYAVAGSRTNTPGRARPRRSARTSRVRAWPRARCRPTRPACTCSSSAATTSERSRAPTSRPKPATRPRRRQRSAC